MTAQDKLAGYFDSLANALQTDATQNPLLATQALQARRAILQLKENIAELSLLNGANNFVVIVGLINQNTTKEPTVENLAKVVAEPTEAAELTKLQVRLEQELQDQRLKEAFAISKGGGGKPVAAEAKTKAEAAPIVETEAQDEPKLEATPKPQNSEPAENREAVVQVLDQLFPFAELPRDEFERKANELKIGNKALIGLCAHLELTPEKNAKSALLDAIWGYFAQQRNNPFETEPEKENE